MPDQAPQPDASGPESLTDIKGWVKLAAGYGFAGLVASVLLFKTIPDMQSGFHAEVQAERDRAEDRSIKSREHAKEVTKELADAIRGLTRTVESNQSAVRENQWQLIELQKKALAKSVNP